MRGYHVLWTKPVLLRKMASHDADFHMSPNELIQLLCSALFWKKHNGKICLVTDELGHEYFQRLGAIEVWDRVDCNCLDEFAELDIDPSSYPTAAKVWTLGRLPVPFCFIDHDLIVYDHVDDSYWKADLCCHHWEMPDPSFYPPPRDYMTPLGYQFCDAWNWQSMIPNTSLFYCASRDFQRRYAAEVMRFLAGSVRMLDPIEAQCNCLFIDQRLVVMLAGEIGLQLETFVNEISPVMWSHPGRGWPDWPDRPRATELGSYPEWVIDPQRWDARKTLRIEHTWTAKACIAQSSTACDAFVNHKLCLAEQEFPEELCCLKNALARSLVRY